jgi:hypothetical protein
MLSACIATNKAVDFFFLLTFWGYLTTLFSVIATIKASLYPEWWQSVACISTQVATGLNLIITPMFWIILAPGIFSSLDYTNPFDIFIAIHMATLHSVPIISSTINIALTDMVLLK